MPNPDSEEALENASLALLGDLGWETVNCFDEVFAATPAGPGRPHLGREDMGQVALLPRLRAALEKLNPVLPFDAIRLAMDELTRDRRLMSPAEANRQVYRLLKEGVKVTVRQGEDADERVETVRVIDWGQPAQNNFLIASQMWITGEMYKRRADLIGFVNGLPLVLIELKAAHRQLKNAYTDNLRDYKDTLPHLFWYNAFIILSNGRESVMGSLTGAWEHFAEWKKINSEGDEGVISLETTLRGTLAPARLLDIVENFVLFAEAKSGLAKLVAKYHQYFGVNNAISATQKIRQNQGRLGVFWHTQGSGKSYSMLFFAQKVMRTVPGNWTFVIVTDRDELDGQIYKNFAGAGVVTEAEDQVRATSGEHLKQLLREDHRYVFTLIHKFHTREGGVYPLLSERSDIIVMADEAHRSQYDTLALNMRTGLPHAAFIGFTGTPLMAGEEKTRQVFGAYVSVYNFAQSVQDRATVPLYYENRIPELQLTNTNLNAEMEQVLEAAELDEAQEKRLEREFAREYHLITRDDRLEKIADDLVAHFAGRGFRGKGMVICIDKATAVRMYDKVKKYWGQHLAGLRARRDAAAQDERPSLDEAIQYMQATDMAVVVSQGQNEVDEFRQKGLDIATHRKRMQAEDLETKFKDPADPFRLVFVCAMWMVGFDAPACSTLYVDKPMRNHTLMQTIARANRVFGEKNNGLIVDYVGVFRDLQRALAIYGTASDGGVQPGDLPVKDKQALLDSLDKNIQETRAFCAGLGADLAAIQASQGFARVAKRDDAVNAILKDDDTKRHYLILADTVDRLFKAILPDLAANRFAPDRHLIKVLADEIRSYEPPADISGVMARVEAVLDRSVEAGAYEIKNPAGSHLVDLSLIDFEALKQQFANGRKHIEIEKLRGALNAKIARLLRLNQTRMDYYERLQRMIEDYNAGAANEDAFFAQLVALAQDLNQEEQRAIGEQLSEEELAIFDLLTKPNIKLNKKERAAVKKVAKSLLDTLKSERLVLDWRKKQAARAAVRLAIEVTLDDLPDPYTPVLYQAKCEVVYQHVYDAYYGAQQSVYGVAG